LAPLSLFGPLYRRLDHPAAIAGANVAINNCCRQQQYSRLASAPQGNKKKGTNPEKPGVDQDSPIQDGPIQNSCSCTRSAEDHEKTFTPPRCNGS
jgi:hypothetical protein